MPLDLFHFSESTNIGNDNSSSTTRYTNTANYGSTNPYGNEPLHKVKPNNALERGTQTLPLNENESSQLRILDESIIGTTKRIIYFNREPLNEGNMSSNHQVRNGELKLMVIDTPSTDSSRLNEPMDRVTLQPPNSIFELAEFSRNNTNSEANLVNRTYEIPRNQSIDNNNHSDYTLSSINTIPHFTVSEPSLDQAHQIPNNFNQNKYSTYETTHNSYHKVTRYSSQNDQDSITSQVPSSLVGESSIPLSSSLSMPSLVVTSLNNGYPYLPDRSNNSSTQLSVSSSNDRSSFWHSARTSSSPLSSSNDNDDDNEDDDSNGTNDSTPNDKGTSQQRDRIFQCKECLLQFRRNNDLKRHSKSHLTIRPFDCPICLKRFSRKDALKRHLISDACKRFFKKDDLGVALRPPGGKNITSKEALAELMKNSKRGKPRKHKPQ